MHAFSYASQKSATNHNSKGDERIHTKQNVSASAAHRNVLPYWSNGGPFLCWLFKDA
jgi:hypothetical protein